MKVDTCRKSIEPSPQVPAKQSSKESILRRISSTRQDLRLSGIPDEFIPWHLHNTVVSRYIDLADQSDSKRDRCLSLLATHAFTTVAQPAAGTSDTNIFRNPLQPAQAHLSYHRSCPSLLNLQASSLVALELQKRGAIVYPEGFLLIDHPLFKNQIELSLACDHLMLTLPPPSTCKPSAIADQIETELQSGFNKITLDVSALFNQPSGPRNTRNFFADLMDQIQVRILKGLMPTDTKSRIKSLTLTKALGIDVVLFDLTDHAKLQTLIRDSGFVPSPEKLRTCLLKSSGDHRFTLPIEAFANPLHLEKSHPKARLALKNLLDNSVALEFAKLQDPDKNPPYVWVMAKATISLLEGLQKEPTLTAFRLVGLEAMLHELCLLIGDEMQYASNVAGEQDDFLRKMQSIHQYIQTILGVMSLSHSYTQGDYSEAFLKPLRHEINPVIPKSLQDPTVHLKSSGMRCLSTILDACRLQKSKNNLRVLTIKDGYYEELNLAKSLESSSVATIDGDMFKQKGQLDFNGDLNDKYDVFIAEFQHNISLTRRKYSPEKVLDIILALHSSGKLEKNFTMIIDNTIGKHVSDDLRDLLHNPKIQGLLASGSMSLNIIRSAQKFDMLGFDNYYGGIICSFSSPPSWKKFQARLESVGDCVGALSIQGLTHLQKYAPESVDEYRQAIMDNTQSLYKALPEEFKKRDGSFPWKVSKISSRDSIFLDFKSFEKNPCPLTPALNIWAKFSHIPLWQRPSFGFPSINAVNLSTSVMRITPGLESRQTIQQWAEGFKWIRDNLNK